MKEQVKIRQKYASLIRAGKLDEAQVLIRIMQNRTVEKLAPVKVAKESVLAKEKIDESVSVEKFKLISDLSKIKGIGKKTVKDIETMFKDIKFLKIALKKDKVALRDDIVEKLKEELI